MRVFFRVDSSLEIGTGHVMRCLTLAEQLRAQGAAVAFISRDLPGNLNSLITAKDFAVQPLPASDAAPRAPAPTPAHAGWLGVSWEEDAAQTRAVLAQQEEPADWLIVDHYALDYRWEVRLRALAQRLMVIDDLADRRHEGDLLLDQNFYVHQEARYAALVPRRCRQLLGPGYALLRPEFREARRGLRPRDGKVGQILIFFGGVDPGNVTARALAAMRLLNRPEIAVDVVIGRTNPHREKITGLCGGRPNVTLHCQVANMAALMARADLAIGAGGTSTWERCCLGLPTMIITIAANQEETAMDLQQGGFTYYLGSSNSVIIYKIYEALLKLLDTPELLTSISSKCVELVDGQGAPRVAAALLTD